MIYTKKIQQALNTAAKYHATQRRKGIDYPYIVHPVAVALILSQYTTDEDILVAGLLHDLIEDVRGYGEGKMRSEFGDKITDIVKEVSEDKEPEMGYEEAKETWRERKEKYIAGLKTDSKSALMVCAADKIHNLWALLEYYARKKEEIWREFNGGREGTIWFYRSVLGVLKARLADGIVAELEKVHDVFEKTVGVRESGI